MHPFKVTLNKDGLLFSISTFIFFLFVENGLFRISLVLINLCIILFLAYKYKVGFNVRCKYTLFILFVISLYYLLEKAFRGESYNYHYFISLLSLLTSILFVSFLISMNKYNSLYKSLKVVLFFHVSLLLIQFSAWYLFNINIDYLYDLGIEKTPQRSSFYGIYRATGFYSEPSIYSTFVLAIITIMYTIKRQTNLLMWAGLISMCLSFSTMGIIQAILYLFCVQMKFSFRNIIIMIFLLSTLSLTFLDKLIQRFQLFNAGEDASNLSKIAIFERWYSDPNLVNFGFSYIDKFNAGIEYIALGDLTFWVNNYMFFGVYIGTVFLAIYLIKFLSPGHLREKILFSIVFLKLSTLTYPLASLLLCFYFSLSKRDEGILN